MLVALHSGYYGLYHGCNNSSYKLWGITKSRDEWSRRPTPNCDCCIPVARLWLWWGLNHCRLAYSRRATWRARACNTIESLCEVINFHRPLNERSRRCTHKRPRPSPWLRNFEPNNGDNHTFQTNEPHFVTYDRNMGPHMKATDQFNRRMPNMNLRQ